ncbi:hypothetical protein AOL_s00083g384 [Orbilia oligospora ATCC 24927]|uniref:phospholipase D n=1 Tax=Arthrobotrys oligospora (strain ATCC 24927 / CBS 115.81 / DSM 1491) TaxID=756982 RepID=G1XHA3_ARTOA|nr:hypothetical protein AOL_s00083g384 [Orbilia oligospora ATCC 24927]EGX47448.1 hypothetical protein AOL_s00083g384 [Orbilia oligospora ATCC 24927]
MGRSRSRSRSRQSGGDDGERRRRKSKDRSRSRDDDKYEGETKEERRARRHRKRKEEKGEEYSTRAAQDKPESGYTVPGGFDYQAPSGYGVAGSAPYPESPQEQRSGYGGEYQQGGEYQHGNYPADSYAQSQYGAGGYQAPAAPAAPTGEYDQAHQEYSGHSQGYSAEHQSYSGQYHEGQSYGGQHEGQSYQQHEGSGYYQHTSPQPTTHYGPPAEQYGATGGEYHDPNYGQAGYAAPQPPYPVEYGEDPNSSAQGYYGGGASSNEYPAGGYPPPTGAPGETPRNPSTHNYQPRAEPSGPPPEAEPQFDYSHTPTQSFAPEVSWRPTAAPETEKQSVFRSFRTGLHNAIREVTNTGKIQVHSGMHEGGVCTDPDHFHSSNRFESFAGVYPGNSIKWFVDGKDYCWAVAEAIKNARHSIWILDWWLSPELHLRRPAAKHEEYRLDRMLKAAAERGVIVNIIVYKEVTQALTLSSAHTKHFLEEQHPNIQVFRHPDHTPDGKVVLSKLIKGNLLNTLTSFTNTDQIVLYWAHHEKLCLIDGVIPGEGIAFMGGLDLCWGRWDLPHHPISDVHPTDIKETVFLGQDYNNARVMDFHTVDQWTQNKLKRTESSRMGWSDVALCLSGPTVDDLKTHFMQRWNFILESKYGLKDTKYHPIEVPVHSHGGFGHGGITHAASKIKSGMKGIIGFQSGGGYEEEERREESSGRRGSRRQRRGGREDYDADLAWSDSDDDSRKKGRRKQERYGEEEQSRAGHHGGYYQQQQYQQQQQQQHPPPHHSAHPINCQIVRSISPWSHNMKTEHSIQNAYVQVINHAHHFVYIENQFFITATDGGRVVKNRIGEALVNRIVRAHRERQKFRVIVVMPSVPAFAGDLKDDGALGTRVIMEYQYDSIVRGDKGPDGKGRSIYEKLYAEGVNPSDYIRFYNLRNYDRINISRELETAEAQTKFEYEVAQQALEDKIGAGWQTAEAHSEALDEWGRVKGASASVWDSVAQCSMLGGGDVRDAPWAGDPDKEIDAFVSEELYIHSKLLIADDRIAICGSANINDRSQLGDHDSEIAIIIEDQTPLQSLMNGQQYTASHFAGTLRRYIFRKHLGLVPAQAADEVDQNSLPVPAPNVYDFDSTEDKLVMDPLGDSFWNHWNGIASTNTQVFTKVFHAVPCDDVVNWEQYTQHYGKYFAPRGTKEKPEPPLYLSGHVVKSNFAEGAEGARQVKEELAKVRGSLVEMPLKFMQNVDFAKEAAGYNAFTEELYT